MEFVSSSLGEGLNVSVPGCSRLVFLRMILTLCLVLPLEGRLLSGAPPFSLCLVIALAATFAVVGAWNSQARDWV